MTDSGHPSRHGFVLCSWCRVWRRASEAEWTGQAAAPDAWQCKDAMWCSNQINGRERHPGTYARSRLDAHPRMSDDESSTTDRPGALGGIPRGPEIDEGVRHE